MQACLTQYRSAGKACRSSAARTNRTTATGQCEYFLRFDLANGITPVPDGTDDAAAGLAYHFVIDSYGVAERGAQSELTLGFYVIAPAGALPEDLVNPPIVRSYWHQRGVN